MTTLARLFVPNDLRANASTDVDSGQAHYLIHVLRLGLDSKVRLFNGRDGEWLGVVEGVRRNSVAIRLVEQLRVQPAAAVAPQLLFAPLKKTRTDFAVEKATELGVGRIQPVFTARTQTQQVRVDRLRVLAREASEQTERLDLPAIDMAVNIYDAIDDWPEDIPLIFCDEAGGHAGRPWGGETGRAAPMADVIREFGSAAGGVLIGPEGGFTSEERNHLRQRDYIHAVTLGPRILRAETAIVSALTIWQSVLGDWR
ncbi:MAG: 16S rRNA (uracil(1498)-N(3))-methyltransferase [Pseudomonadota bacterium]